MKQHSTAISEGPPHYGPVDALTALHDFVEHLQQSDLGMPGNVDAGLKALASELRWAQLELRMAGPDGVGDVLVHACDNRPAVPRPGVERQLVANITGRGVSLGTLRLTSGQEREVQDSRLLQVLAELLAEPIYKLQSEQTGVMPRTATAANANGGDGSLKGMMDAFEREILVAAMLRAGGVQSRAARALQTTPRILAYRLRRHGLHQELARPHRSNSSSA